MTEITEGGVTVRVEEARDGASAGTSDAVFYNPEMELNRDVTVAVLRAHAERRDDGTEPGRGGATGSGDPDAGDGTSGGDGGDDTNEPGDATPSVDATYFDATTASGIRATRAAAAGYTAVGADVDPDAVALARENLASYPDARVVHEDANVRMHRESFDVVDVDPYGSPVPFADAATRCARELLCVTATDTAPLCGAHFDSGRRRYETTPRNTEYHPEMGLRVLLSSLVRTGAKHDVALTPVCSHVSRHYARTYLAVDHSATAANEAVAELGHVAHCQDCLYREHEHGLLADSPETCPNCDGDRVVTAGPLWLGQVADTAFTTAVREHVTDDMGEAKRARRLLDTVASELGTPTHYDQHRLCELWGRPASAMDEFVAALREAGHEATRAHYAGTAFETTADVSEIRAATAHLD
ncbi:tRNA (guanine(26)-N(2))-dimethyltransferase [Halobaculum sp. MBLA0147]|uniref:tRNA (guanine(26)-N(2))-dimethyltransferase n=1 Tax=Halobaculum sp. MBLA0147 TaxID=3079934 RepID=UPI003526551D